MSAWMGVCLLGRTASAGDLQWSSGGSCAEEGAVAATLDEVDPDGTSAVLVHVAAQGEELVAEVTIEGRSGRTQRRLASRDCETLRSAVAWLVRVSLSGNEAAQQDAEPVEPLVPEAHDGGVAVQAGDQAAERAQTADRAQTKPAVAVAPRQRSAEPLPEPKRPPRPRSKVAVRGLAAGHVSVGKVLMADVDVVPGGAVGLSGRRFRVQLDARVWVPRDTEEGPGLRVRYGAWAVGASACYVHWATERVALEPCAGALLGRMTGRGRGPALAQSMTHRSTFAAATLGAHVRIELLRHLALRGGLEGTLLGRRPQFAVEGLGVVHRVAPAGIAGAVALEVHFP